MRAPRHEGAVGHLLPGLGGVRSERADTQEAYSLPGNFHRDPADRILVATCRLRGLALLTADRLILDYPHVTALW